MINSLTYFFQNEPINQADFGGCMDVIVVERPDQTLVSTAFHVRFGKIYQFQANRQKIQIYVNDQKTPFCMKMGNNGEAYFISKQNNTHVKKIRLSNQYLQQLDLKYGANKLKYCINQQEFQECKIYLYKHDQKLVLCDIDGTVTKSDLGGFFFNLFKMDFSHDGIVSLFQNLKEQKNVEFVYLSARNFQMYEMTKNQLNRTIQNGKKLLEGPVLLSPDFIVESLKREIIFRNPEIMKGIIVKDLKSLFLLNIQPFVAGFGNRHSDYIAYKLAGLDNKNIYIIDKQSEITIMTPEQQDKKISYQILDENFQQYFGSKTI